MTTELLKLWATNPAPVALGASSLASPEGQGGAQQPLKERASFTGNLHMSTGMHAALPQRPLLPYGSIRITQCHPSSATLPLSLAQGPSVQDRSQYPQHNHIQATLSQLIEAGAPQRLPQALRSSCYLPLSVSEWAP